MGSPRAGLEKARKEVACLFKETREKAGKAQHQIADYLGVDRPTVSTFERGMRSLRVEELFEYCWAYGVDVQKVIDLLNVHFSRSDQRE